MGTNYYAIRETNVCPNCGRKDVDMLHIGKSSAGWCFALRVHPNRAINSLKGWSRYWSLPGVRIEDECGETISKAEMRAIITERKWDGCGWTEDSLRENYATKGPNGLARHNDANCVGHGSGTWDLIDGEFS